jgi:hypothetical protein
MFSKTGDSSADLSCSSDFLSDSFEIDLVAFSKTFDKDSMFSDADFVSVLSASDCVFDRETSFSDRILATDSTSVLKSPDDAILAFLIDFDRDSVFSAKDSEIDF